MTKTLGGGLKGALAASPLKPLATGLGVATTGAIEDYIYCIANGETHEQALKSAAINGHIEGLTVGGCKWLGNAVANKVKVRPEVKNTLESKSAVGSGSIFEGLDFVQLEDHIFSDKHIKGGIMTLGKSRKDILRSGMDIINDLSSKGMLKEGSTQIKTLINDSEAEIRLFMRNGKLMNFDMFLGHSPRTMGNTIIY